MNPRNDSSTTVAVKGNPDVIIIRADQTTVFKMQNRRVSEWLRKHFNSAAGSAKGDTEIYVHPTRYKRIVEELKAAGFVVATERE
ncbi:MAG TPA: hypothetical protein VGY56_03705 [Verrucomicrobiae bacterium]|nr:hypothetical protein [Verrucomicrobiae bacterium]